jgi:toxin ParE1/3/4
MAGYSLSESAKSDISKTYEFGIENFGLSQAQLYLDQMHEHFQSLAENPEIGRSAFEYAPGLRRFAFASHTIFYLPLSTGAFIVRVLGQPMNYQEYL